MPSFVQNPTFLIYSLCAAVLSLNMLGLWGYSGAVRSKTKTTPNPEDPVTVAKGATVVDVDPPKVARVLRAHTNAQANIPPFLALGLVYVLLGTTPTMAWIFFGGFTAARLAHSFAYLNARQPFRTIFFTVGGLITLVLVVQILRIVIPAMMAA